MLPLAPLLRRDLLRCLLLDNRRLLGQLLCDLLRNVVRGGNRDRPGLQLDTALLHAGHVSRVRRNESLARAGVDEFLKDCCEVLAQAIRAVQKLAKLGLEKKIRMCQSPSESPPPLLFAGCVRPVRNSNICIVMTTYAFKWTCYQAQRHTAHWFVLCLFHRGFIASDSCLRPDLKETMTDLVICKFRDVHSSDMSSPPRSLLKAFTWPDYTQINTCLDLTRTLRHIHARHALPKQQLFQASRAAQTEARLGTSASGDFAVTVFSDISSFLSSPFPPTPGTSRAGPTVSIFLPFL